MAVFNAKLCNTEAPPIFDHWRSYLHQNVYIDMKYLWLSREDDTIRLTYLICFVNMQRYCEF